MNFEVTALPSTVLTLVVATLISTGKRKWFGGDVVLSWKEYLGRCFLAGSIIGGIACSSGNQTVLEMISEQKFLLLATLAIGISVDQFCGLGHPVGSIIMTESINEVSARRPMFYETNNMFLHPDSGNHTAAESSDHHAKLKRTSYIIKQQENEILRGKATIFTISRPNNDKNHQQTDTPKAKEEEAVTSTRVLPTTELEGSQWDIVGKVPAVNKVKQSKHYADAKGGSGNEYAKRTKRKCFHIHVDENNHQNLEEAFVNEAKEASEVAKSPNHNVQTATHLSNAGCTKSLGKNSCILPAAAAVSFCVISYYGRTLLYRNLLLRVTNASLLENISTIFISLAAVPTAYGIAWFTAPSDGSKSKHAGEKASVNGSSKAGVWTAAFMFLAAMGILTTSRHFQKPPEQNFLEKWSGQMLLGLKVLTGCAVAATLLLTSKVSRVSQLTVKTIKTCAMPNDDDLESLDEKQDQEERNAKREKKNAKKIRNRHVNIKSKVDKATIVTFGRKNSVMKNTDKMRVTEG